MKKFVFIILMVCGAAQIHAQFSKATLQANGLTCAMCSNAVSKALQKIPFIETVRADLKNTAFNINFKQNANVDVDAIKAAVESAGFSVGYLKLTGQFNNLKIANDEHVQIGNSNFHFLHVKDQILNGEKTLTVLDKNFVSDKTFKTVKTFSQMDCVTTGKAGHCCANINAGARMYHVTI